MEHYLRTIAYIPKPSNFAVVTLLKKSLSICLLVLTLLCLTASTVYATPQTLTVSPISQRQITLNLNKGVTASGSISVASGDINLIISDPAGGIVANYSQVSSQSFSFTADTGGTYTVTLDNSYLLSSKSVTIDYSVQNSVLGIPQNIIIMFVVVVAILIAAVFITRYMAKKPKDSIVNTNEIYFFTKQKRDETIAYCPKCGTSNDKENLYCKKCGKSLSEENKKIAPIDNSSIDEDLQRNQVDFRAD